MVGKQNSSKARSKAQPATPAAALAEFSLKDDVLLGTVEAAAVVGLAAKTMRQLRCDKAGPRCFKLGTNKQARTVYRRSDLEAWVRSRIAAVHGA